MTVNWYNIGNKAEFEAKGIPQEAFTKELEDLGQQEIVFLKGFFFFGDIYGGNVDTCSE